jgi:predicted GIY-YIG superfamily endonuclease
MRDLISKVLRNYLVEQQTPKWTKDEVEKEVQKYKTKSEFQKNSNSAYQAAVRNKWLKDVTQDYIQVLKTWTKDEVIDLAKQFTKMNDFKKTYPKAYGAARHNGWLKDVREIMTPAYEKWDVEKLKDISSKYNNLQKFRDEQPKVLDAIRSKELYYELTKHMDRGFHYWTKDEVAKEASKYSNRTDFVTNSNQAYQAAVNNGWYEDVTNHMKYLGNIYKRLVYVYEFPDNTAYIGLTLSEERRNIAHTTREGSPVFKHIKETGLKPVFKIVSDEYIDSEDAQNLERCTIDKYKSDGWIVLNKAKGGGLGFCKRIWEKDKIMEIALMYTKMNDFKKNSPKAYQAARIYGLIEEIRKIMTPAYDIKTDEDLNQIMSKYNSMNDFRKNDYKYFQQAFRRLGNQYIKDFYLEKKVNR